MSTSHNSGTAGGSAGNALKEGAAKIHGLGEAIRGNINEFADNATGSDPTKSRNIAARGVDEVETGKYAGTGAGVTPHDTDRERLNRNLQGEGNTFTHGTTGMTGATTTGGSTTTGPPPVPERRA